MNTRFNIGRGRRSRRIAETAQFAGALAIVFLDQLPRYFRNNYNVVAAWWSLALYVRGVLDYRFMKLRQSEWDKAAGLVARRLTLSERLVKGGTDDWIVDERYEPDPDMLQAFHEILLMDIKLWKALLGAAPDKAQFLEREANLQKIYAAFADESLGLRHSFKLYIEEDLNRDIDAFDMIFEEPVDEITEFSELAAVFLETCARSEP